MARSGRAAIARVAAATDARSVRRRRYDDYVDVRVVGVRPHAGFSGWVWDARRRVWTERREGVAVREVRG